MMSVDNSMHECIIPAEIIIEMMKYADHKTLFSLMVTCAGLYKPARKWFASHGVHRYYNAQKYKNTAVYKIVEHGYIDASLRYIGSRCINETIVRGACKLNRVDVIKMFDGKYIDNNCMSLACSNGSYEVVDYLIEKFPYYNIYLLGSCSAGCARTVARLIDLGATPSVINLCCAIVSRNLDTVKLIVESGVTATSDIVTNAETNTSQEIIDYLTMHTSF